MPEYVVTRRRPHAKQRDFIASDAKRKCIRAGRRSGKTTGAAYIAVDAFLKGHRVLYATPTSEQIDRFWHEVKRAFREPLRDGVLYKHEGLHILSFPDVAVRIDNDAFEGDAVPGEETRIRAKTAWDADSLRGDYADLLILDEWQLMNEEAWGRVGAPMLLDNDGDAVFIYTPPSRRSRSRTKARDPMHAAKLFKKAQEDESGRWAAFHFTSHDNPHISKAALEEISHDMTRRAIEQEILALDLEDDPDALWRRQEMIEDHRVTEYPDLLRVAVGVDPPGGAAECGIVCGGVAMVDGKLHGYVLEDRSLHGSPNEWGREVVTAYRRNQADRVLGEANFGGDMVESTIRTVDADVSYKAVRASRGKAVRAEPVAALYEQGRIHHVGQFEELEDELATWVPDSGMPSPNRLDALVWLWTDLIVKREETKRAGWGW